MADDAGPPDALRAAALRASTAPGPAAACSPPGPAAACSPPGPAAAREPPLLCLLGPIHLDDAGGPVPTRSRRQALELCAWLLEHPHATAAEMAADLAVAEPTRRSNLSRLRRWLGADPSGQPYLPPAYSGRIALHPGVASDWECFRRLTGPDVTAAPDAALVRALSLVRGPVLADAPPGSWLWAEGIRARATELVIRASAAVAVRSTDPHTSWWALERGLLAAPDSPTLARLLTPSRRPCPPRRLSRGSDHLALTTSR